jgi:hypothetical protein
MTVTLAKHPARQKRGPPGRGYVPDRPPGGYHVIPGDTVTSALSEANHSAELARAIARIQKADHLMTTLERRLETITTRLNDPDLLDEIPAGDPRRLEAEDTRDELRDHLSRQAWVVSNAAGMIATHGAYLAGAGRADELTAVGRGLSLVDGPLARILATCPGIETHPTYLTLCREAVAF